MNSSSTLAETITIVSSSLLLKSVTSLQFILLIADLTLTWVPPFYAIVNGKHCIFDAHVVTGSLKEDIWAFPALRAASLGMMFHPKWYTI